jgi:hypothetical protein
MISAKRAAGTPDLASRLIIGALAGIAATVAMTAAMQRMYRLLPSSEQYPLPPREITQRVLPYLHGDDAIKDAAIVSHAGYGAAAGALVGAVGPEVGPLRGALAGAGVWAASYFGWVPAASILLPAHRHPARRNALMIAAHLVWGAVTAVAFRELAAARAGPLVAGPLGDAPRRKS